VSQQALLALVVAALDEAGIAYMVSGSLASSLQGEPRATHDIGLVVAVSADDVARLARRLDDPGLFLDEDSAADAVAHSTLFNLIEISTGDKVDLWPLTDDPFDRSSSIADVGLPRWG
jgi:hypothetical protein